jgi:hypothetical protein
MSTQTADLNLKQGMDYTEHLQWLDDITGEPVDDLSTYTAIQQIRTSYDNPDILLECSTGNGKITMDDTANIYVTYSADDTINFPIYGVRDLRISNPDGDVVFLIEGEVVTKRSVTRV